MNATIKSVYVNSDNFKMQGLKWPGYDNLLNVMVVVSAIDDTKTTFGNGNLNIGDVVEIDVADSQSPNGNVDCFAKDEVMELLDVDPVLIGFCSKVLGYIKTNNDQDLDNVTLAI